MHLTEIDESYWNNLAADVARVGRWVWDMEANICLIDDTLRAITGLEHLPKEVDPDDFMGRIHPDDVEAVQLSAQAARENGKTFSAQFRFVGKKDEPIWLEGRGAFVELPDGKEVLIGVNYDVTTHMELAESNARLVGEMGHRIKNTLALISGLFRMASKSATDVAGLSDAFMGRLAALASLNDFILASAHQGASTDELVNAVFLPHGDDPRVSRTVARFSLNGSAAQTMMLALNELYANAVKFGALSQSEGSIKMTLSYDADADELALHWREEGMTGLGLPEKTDGFGLTVLNRMVKSSFEGEPELWWHPDGLEYCCKWRASKMAARHKGTSLDADLHPREVLARAEA